MVGKKSVRKKPKMTASKRKISQTEENPPNKRRKRETTDQQDVARANCVKKTAKTKSYGLKTKNTESESIKNEKGERSEMDSPLAPESSELKTEEKGIGDYSAKENKFIGAHVSIAGHLRNAVIEAVQLKARAFGMFLKSQRQWNAKPLDIKIAEEFKAACKEHRFDPKYILPHGSYLMNLASPNPESLAKSRNMFIDELQRCEELGLEMFNFHPGSTCGDITVEEGIQNIAESINQAHKKTSYVTAVLENMCCQGNTLGGHFEELAAVIKQVTDKTRVGVCIDTCHAFAAGFDLSTEKGFKAMMADFDRIVGLKYLRAVHVNDSKGDVGCHLDRHENIGKGKIGIEGFRRIMNDPRFDNIPFILETPGGDYQREIMRLYKLCAS